ncbi:MULTISPECIES: hypothetical protein [Paenibacillus]|uniref:Uncharacterized protein n=1 Tax=Paenibacillus naphthalenovorans TaxID=162209 RepID=A0A0U2VY67_9BACL|nr:MULTISPECIES: hypothetical protein [Paenibacillus]ALS24439.1 hypothetical protein IJ22_41430 [Paenibacillus naphthalenovorans]NTZ20545.1 hypothetical protein [Paenibacillus sp. JMULE4]GCL73718.1 hypothetical protein PN4B1_36590 [Paenibacillus naphthalenovorans]SDJ13897.1 hypothetical protein SAMN05421868_11842 [Paenibacillus naphthalenovorans]
MNKDTQIVETVAGTWLRFPNSFKKSHCLVELPDQISLNINVKNGSVNVYKKDGNHVYQYIGDVFISSTGNQLQCSAVSAQNPEEDRSLQQSDAS